MTNMKNNFYEKNQNNNCPRCHHEQDDEEHLFSYCSQLGSLYGNYKITNWDEAFERETGIEEQ